MRILLRWSLCGSLAAIAVTAPSIASAQRQMQRTPPSATSNPNVNRPPQRPATAANRAAAAAINLYTDAANFQNAGAYPLAIEAWKKFLVANPNDALASKAKHYLGVCLLQKEAPDYEAAIASFKAALADPKLEVREETLVNLGWCLYSTSNELEGKTKTTRLNEALAVLNQFVEAYPDGSYIDKAYYYAAESEYQLGNVSRAASMYRQIVSNEKFARSAIVPDSMYALAVAYEELNQAKLAAETYDKFLAKYADHRLAREVKLRKAEFLIAADKADMAVELLAEIAADQTTPMRDYVLYRYAYALSKAGKFDASSKVYQQLGKEFPNSEFSTDSALAAGQALMRQQRYDDAKAFFSKLLPAKDETAAQAAHWLAQIAAIQNKPADVVSIARDALAWANSSQWNVALQMDLADALAGTADGAEEATTIYENVALSDPTNPAAPRAAYNAAFAALRRGDTATATKWVEFFTKQYQNDPLASEVAAIRGETLLQSGKSADAAAAFEQLISAYPKSTTLENWKLRAATAYFLAGNFDKAIPALTMMAESATDANAKGEALFLLGASYFKQDKLPQAIQSLNQSTAIEPAWRGADEAYLVLAEVHSKAGDVEKARATLQQLITKFPKSSFLPQAEFRLGQISADTRDFDRAIAAYNAVLQSDETKLHNYAAYGKAWVMIQQGRFQDALPLTIAGSRQTTDAALQIESTIAAANCLRELKRPGEAVKILQTLGKSATANADPQTAAKIAIELVSAYQADQQLEKAVAQLNSVIAKYEDYPNLDANVFSLALTLRNAGRDDLATQMFQKLAEDFPASPHAAESAYQVAQQSYSEQDFPRAVKAYTVALSKSNDSHVREKSLYKLGWAYFQQANWIESAKFFANQASEFPAGELAVDAYFMQGECAMKLANAKDALRQYTKASKLISATSDASSLNPQITELVYLHGAQAAGELKSWDSAIAMADDLAAQFPDSQYLALAQFERAYALQGQKQFDQALQAYEKIADANRDEIGARSRFMMGEIYFGKQEFTKAVQEFQKVMYGFGATQAPAAIKNWQARSAIEAGRCSDLLIGDLKGEQRSRAVKFAIGFYDFVATNHADHELAEQARNRLTELRRM